MKLTELFLSALREYEKSENVNEEMFPLVSITYDLLFKLGGGNPKTPDSEQYLALLQDRIKHLVEQQGLYEFFLIPVLIEEVKKALIHNIENHGSAILSNEFGQKRAIELNRTDMVDVYESPLSRLKSSSYIQSARKALEAWELIVTQKLNKSTIKELEDKDINIHFENYLKDHSE